MMKPNQHNAQKLRNNTGLAHITRPYQGLGFIQDEQQSKSDDIESVLSVADDLAEEEIKESNEPTSMLSGKQSSVISVKGPKLDMFQIKASVVSQAEKPALLMGSLPKNKRTLGRQKKAQHSFFKL